MGSRRDVDDAGLRGFPLAFLGYGFLYAWGYVSWNTDSLSTLSVSGPSFDLSWMVSAVVVPLALVFLAFIGRNVDLEHLRPLYLIAPCLAVAGSMLSVVLQHTGQPFVATTLAVLSGMGTGIASALFATLWSLAFCRLNITTLELVVPLSFVVSALSAVVVPSLARVPALIVAAMLALFCGFALLCVHAQLEGGSIDSRWLETAETGVDRRAETRPAGVARMLAYSVFSWALFNVAPAFAGDGAGLFGGIDLSGFLGYIVAIVFSLVVIRYAVRVDFHTLAFMTLAPFALSMLCFALPGGLPLFVATTLNVALNSACEIILMLYFVRIAQGQVHRAFWVALGCAASYLGVFIGQFATVWCVRLGLFAGNHTLFCLLVVCVYTIVMLFVPQRHPYHVEVPRVGASHVDAGATSPAPAIIEAAGSDSISLACVRIAQAYQLSARETQVCEYLARGRSQAYIRDALFLSKNTVATHTRRLYAKLGVHSKQELIDLVEHNVGQ